MASSIPTLIQDIVQNGTSYEQACNQTNKRALIKAASRLIAELEAPMERTNKIMWGDPSRNAALKVAFEMGILKKLNTTQAASSAQLAEGTPAEPFLIARTLKILAAYHIVEEVGKDQYQATSYSAAIANEPFLIGALTAGLATMTPSVTAASEFLAANNYRVPIEGTKVPFQHALKTDKTFFGYLAANAPIASAFKNYMGGFNKTDTPWVDVYPCAERLTTTSKDEIVIVDVGGGMGHEIARFHSKHPSIQGHLILQDVAAGLANRQDTNPQSSAIEPVEHDFFTPQPEKYRGAKAYYLRHILHDWPDDKCKEILSHLRDAMTPGYSKVLVNDIVVNDVGSPWQQACMDWLMMSLLAAKERTESEWRALFASAGLKVTGIWRDLYGDHAIIEAVLADD